MAHKRTVVHAVRQLMRLLHVGTVFTPAELVAMRLGSPNTIRQALARLVRAGELRRVRKGYYMPSCTPAKDILTEASPVAIEAAFARKAAAREPERLEVNVRQLLEVPILNRSSNS